MCLESSSLSSASEVTGFFMSASGVSSCSVYICNGMKLGRSKYACVGKPVCLNDNTKCRPVRGENESKQPRFKPDQSGDRKTPI